jgi:hypothetical protein
MAQTTVHRRSSLQRLWAALGEEWCEKSIKKKKKEMATRPSRHAK